MAEFPIHDEKSAPEAARANLEGARKGFGFLPNLLGEMAAAPPVLEGYLTLNKLVQKTSLSPVEQQVAILAVATENDCHYCAAAHTGTATMAEVPKQVVDALREKRELPDERLNALARFTRQLVAQRGWATDDEVGMFLAAGYTEENVLEVILVIAMKTLSNYVNHVTGTPLDESLAQFRWGAPQAA